MNKLYKLPHTKVMNGYSRISYTFINKDIRTDKREEKNGKENAM